MDSLKLLEATDMMKWMKWVRLNGLLFAIGGLGGLALAGCGNMNPGVGNGSNGNTDQNGDNSLTQQQGEIAKEIADRVNSLIEPFASFAPLFDQNVFNPEGGSTMLGQCPEITASRNQSGGSATFDYGSGCITSEAFGNVPVSGSVMANYTIEQGNVTAVVDFNNFTVDDKAIGAGITGPVTFSANGATFEANIDMQGPRGPTVGDVTVVYNRTTQVILIPDGQVTVTTADGTSYDVTINNLLADPTNSGSLVPVKGAASFDLPDSNTGNAPIPVAIDFSGDSSTSDNSSAAGGISITVGVIKPIDLPGG